MKIAIVSLDQIWINKIANQEKCIDFIKIASQNSADLIIFPEMTLTGFSMDTHQISEELDKSPTLLFFSEQASKYSIAIIAGVVLKNQNKATNNLFLIDNIGTILSIYSKIHPFSFSGENNFYIGGNEIMTSSINNVNIGFTICYDLRFPEIYRALSSECQIIVNIANWPEKRINQWNILLQARAVENQCFIIGANRIGLDGNGLNYIKSSKIYNPNGDEVLPIFCNNELDIYKVNIEEVKKLRDSFCIQQDRKNKLYKTWL